MKFTEKDIGKSVEATCLGVTFIGQVVRVSKRYGLVKVKDKFGVKFVCLPERVNFYVPPEADREKVAG